MDLKKGSQEDVKEDVRKKMEKYKQPLDFLDEMAKDKKKILIKCHMSKYFIGTLYACDKHFNMILADIQEKWRAKKRYRNGTRKMVTSFRTYNKIFLRGENIIYIREVTDDMWKDEVEKEFQLPLKELKQKLK